METEETPPQEAAAGRNRYDSALLAVRQDGAIIAVRDAVLIVVPADGGAEPRAFELEPLIRDELAMFDDRRAEGDPDEMEDGVTVRFGEAAADDAAAARVAHDRRGRGAFRSAAEFDAAVAERRSLLRRIESLQAARRGADPARRAGIASELADLEAEASVLRGRFRAFESFRGAHGGKPPWTDQADGGGDGFDAVCSLPRADVRDMLADALARVRGAVEAGLQAERSRALREVSALQRRLRELDGIDDPRATIDRRLVQAVVVRYDWLLAEIHDRAMLDVPGADAEVVRTAARRAFVEAVRCFAGIAPDAVESLLGGRDDAAA